MENNFGLSKKTNVAMASVAGISMVKDSINAIIAITIIALTVVVIQGYLDYKKGKQNA